MGEDWDEQLKIQADSVDTTTTVSVKEGSLSELVKYISACTPSLDDAVLETETLQIELKDINTTMVVEEEDSGLVVTFDRSDKSETDE